MALAASAPALLPALPPCQTCPRGGCFPRCLSPGNELLHCREDKQTQATSGLGMLFNTGRSAAQDDGAPQPMGSSGSPQRHFDGYMGQSGTRRRGWWWPYQLCSAGAPASMGMVTTPPNPMQSLTSTSHSSKQAWGLSNWKPNDYRSV